MPNDKLRDRGRERPNLKTTLIYKMGHLQPLFHLFSVLLIQKIIFHQIIVKSISASIQFWDSNSWHLEHESLPITTKPRLSPKPNPTLNKIFWFKSKPSTDSQFIHTRWRTSNPVCLNERQLRCHHTIVVITKQCDQIGRFFALWATF